MDIGNPKAAGGAFDYMSLEDLLNNIVNNAVFAGLVVGALILGIGFLLYQYRNHYELTDNQQLALVLVLSPVVVLCAYGLRLLMHQDYYTPERLFAVLSTVAFAIIGSEVVRRLFMAFLNRIRKGGAADKG